MRFPFFTPGFYPTTIGSTPSNSQLEQMVVEEGLADYAGVVVMADAAPDVVFYPDLAKCVWHKTVAGAKTGYFYYYNGTAWTPTKVSPGTLTGDSFADGSIGIEKLTPGTPYYVPQVNAAGDAVVWVSAPSLFTNGSLAWGTFAYASAQDNFLCSNVGGDWSEITKAVAANKLSTAVAAAPITTINDIADDGIWCYQASGNLAKGISHIQYLETLINAYTELAATATDDKVAVLDVSDPAGIRMKAVTLDNLMPATGVTPGTYVGGTGFTVRADGRISAVDTAGVGTIYSTATADLVALPTVAGDANSALIPHGLGTIPRMVSVRLVCTTTDAGWAVNDEVDISAVMLDEGGTDYNPLLVVSATSTHIRVMQPLAASGRFIPNKGTGAVVTFTPGSWKLRGFAIK